jgi:inorganic pyrophosphatase
MNFEIEGIIEIPKGSKYKYEVDKESGVLVLDRPLLEKIPYNYGYLSNSLGNDGDPLDVCVLGYNSIVSLAKVKLEVKGALICSDNGVSDDKILATVVGEFISPYDLSNFIDEAISYLSRYKEGFVVYKFVPPEEAYEIIMKATEAYINA